jgi:Flp pilus assembly protein CpaB
MSRRTIALVVALVLAAVAAIALVSYVQGIQHKNDVNQQPVQVFVAKAVIPAGQSGDQAISQGLITEITIPLKARTDGAISSLEQIKGKVAAVDIQKNEQILASRFGAPGTTGQTGAAKLVLPSNLQAVSIQVSIPPGVAGFIQVGETVSVLADADITATGGRPAGRTVGYIAQNVKVLAIGQLQTVIAANGNQTQQTAQNAGQVLLTLAVNPAQAERLILGTLDAQLYFTIVPANQKATNTPARLKNNIFTK